MGKNLETQYSFRCDKDTIKKLEFIANQNTRTRNQEMKHIIKKHIDEYEKIHGEIQLKEETIIEKIADILPAREIGNEIGDIVAIELKKKRNNSNK